VLAVYRPMSRRGFGSLHSEPFADELGRFSLAESFLFFSRPPLGFPLCPFPGNWLKAPL
jgi:hypothetical protein